MAGQRRDGREVTALDADLTALTPAHDILALFVIDRVAAAVTAADADAAGLACGFQTGIEAAGNSFGQLGRVAVLGFGVEGHLHGVMIDRLLDLGAQRYLVVADVIRLGAAGKQRSGEQQASHWQKWFTHGVLLVQCTVRPMQTQLVPDSRLRLIVRPCVTSAPFVELPILEFFACRTEPL